MYRFIYRFKCLRIRGCKTAKHQQFPTLLTIDNEIYSCFVIMTQSETYIMLCHIMHPVRATERSQLCFPPS